MFSYHRASVGRVVRALVVPTLLVTACDTQSDVTTPRADLAASTGSADVARGSTSVGSVDATVSLDIAKTTRAVNRLVLGSNTQWVDRGDELMSWDGSQLAPAMLASATATRPTVLRYPGGILADYYHWQDGMGAVKTRPMSKHVLSGVSQQVLFGTAEFLDLCRRLGAEPLVTANVVTGTPSEAAAWVRAVNVDGMKASDGTRLPSVRYWEVGNEPYLRDPVRPDSTLSPANFAQRASAVIGAMRATDPTIRVGVPMRLDRIGDVPVIYFPGYANTVLGKIKDSVDFVTLHNSYLPFVWDNNLPADDQLFTAAMAAYRVIETDFDSTRSTLKRLAPNRSIGLAVTEYAPLFTLGGSADALTTTFGGALYAADALRVFASASDVVMANHWSLTGNGYFGAISNLGTVRPVSYVLSAYDAVLNGRIVPSTVTGPTFDLAARVGLVPAQKALPVVTSLATIDGKTVHVLLMNKSLTKTLNVNLQGTGTISAVREQVLASSATGSAVLRATSVSGWTTRARATVPAKFPFATTLPPSSLVWVDVTLR